MADTGTRLRAFLQANAAVKALVGDRVYQDKIPQQVLKQNPVPPLICFQQFGSRRESVLDEPVGDAPFATSYNLDAISENSGTAIAIRDAANGCLHGYRGTFDDSTVKGCFCNDQSKDYESFAIGADSGLHVASQIVEVIP